MVVVSYPLIRHGYKFVKMVIAQSTKQKKAPLPVRASGAGVGWRQNASDGWNDFCKLACLDLFSDAHRG